MYYFIPSYYLLFQKSNQVRPVVQVKNNRQKKSTEIVVDPVLQHANDLVRQSSIEPKKYIQNQLMFKKNKDKIGNVENSSESLTSQKQVKKLLDVPELFSSPDVIVIDDNKSLKVENVESSSKINIIKKNQNITTLENSASNITKDVGQVNIKKEESGRVRKVSNRMKDNPAEITVTKTVEDILNDISSKIANQTEIIDEENLIDELADLNEDLNSVSKLIMLSL